MGAFAWQGPAENPQGAAPGAQYAIRLMQ